MHAAPGGASPRRCFFLWPPPWPAECTVLHTWLGLAREKNPIPISSHAGSYLCKSCTFGHRGCESRPALINIRSNLNSEFLLQTKPNRLLQIRRLDGRISLNPIFCVGSVSFSIKAGPFGCEEKKKANQMAWCFGVLKTKADITHPSEEEQNQIWCKK